MQLPGWAELIAYDPEAFNRDTFVRMHHAEMLRREKTERLNAQKRAQRSAMTVGLRCWGQLLDKATRKGRTARQWASIEQTLDAWAGQPLALAKDDDEVPQGWELAPGVPLSGATALALAEVARKEPVALADVEAILSSEISLGDWLALPATQRAGAVAMCRWLDGEKYLDEVALEELVHISEHPPEIRFAILKGVCPLQAAKNSALRFSCLPPSAQWKKLLGAETSPVLYRIPTKGFKAGVLKRLIQEFNVDLRNDVADVHGVEVRGVLGPLAQLTRLFADYGKVKRFVETRKLEWSARGLHDAGQYALPDDFTPAKWVSLAMSHPEVLTRARDFEALEKKGVFPRSTNEFRMETRRLQYPTVSTPREIELASLCLELGMSAEDFRDHLMFWRKVEVKTAEFCPGLTISGTEIGLGQDWVLEKLAADSLEGPLLGIMTGCCQHLGAVGRACAQHGVESPYSAFYVVRYKRKIVAQSWAWRAGDSIVFDSLESRYKSIEELAPVLTLFQEAGSRMVSSAMLGVTAVLVGLTGSGATAHLAERAPKSSCQYKLSPFEPCDYRDAIVQVRLYGRVLRRRKLPDTAEKGKRSRQRTRNDSSLFYRPGTRLEYTRGLATLTLYSPEIHGDLAFAYDRY